MRLDPRSPLVINTHELGRRPGSMRTLEFTAPAPSDVGTPLLRVPPGSLVDVQLRLEAVMEGVLATGEASVVLSGECARCLEEFDDSLQVPLQELYVYPESDVGDDEARRLDGELLDLEPLLRDSVVLALPFQPVCAADCPGLCVECGAVLRDNPAHTHERDIDPRWAVLSAIHTDVAGSGASQNEE
jgi:uncharacterized protein